SYHHSATPDRLVTWVESHDTYANEHESAGLTDEQIRMGWVFLTSRAHGTPLFFSRPAGSTRENYWGNNLSGARVNDEFKNPEVVAVNAFRKAMHGQPETIIEAAQGAVAAVERGKAGESLINFSSEPQTIGIPTSLPDGEYTDAVHGTSFTIANGTLTGTLAPLTSYILYAK
ncbi:MAG: alpha-amylase, partial [Duncaniella sp.]|nr:alpha-amylase [Duncaniella sp.]